MKKWNLEDNTINDNLLTENKELKEEEMKEAEIIGSDAKECVDDVEESKLIEEENKKDK